jgi:hypothetical protein
MNRMLLSGFYFSFFFPFCFLFSVFCFFSWFLYFFTESVRSKPRAYRQLPLAERSIAIPGDYVRVLDTPQSMYPGIGPVRPLIPGTGLKLTPVPPKSVANTCGVELTQVFSKMRKGEFGLGENANRVEHRESALLVNTPVNAIGVVKQVNGMLA